MKILGDKRYYRPREIAEQGLITNSRGDEGTAGGHYDYILRLIAAGKLKAINHGTSDYRSYFLVSEDEIQRFNKEKDLSGVGSDKAH